MGKPRYRWWSYVKACIREYPVTCRQIEEAHDFILERGGASYSRRRPTENLALLHIAQSTMKKQEAKEFLGVRYAIEDLLTLPDGMERFNVLDRVFWADNKLTIAGSAMVNHVSERTAERWHNEFIRLVALKMGLLE